MSTSTPKGRETTARTAKATQVKIGPTDYDIGVYKTGGERVRTSAGKALPPTSLRGVLLDMKDAGVVYVQGSRKTPIHMNVKPNRPTVGDTLQVGGKTITVVKSFEARTSNAELSVGDAGPLELHHKVLEGIATKSLLDMLERFDAIPKQELLTALGVSERTLQRHRDGRLGSDVASVALDLAAITEQAQSVLGSMAEAQRWLTTGAVALKGQRPLDLLSTRQGADLVRDLLVRMEYGVYA
ncbi:MULTISPECIES: antitoxin Xre/MbcA/ParS toxin-binding domain-containing protein [unclassified Hydrogenophaga]|jgi:putative toxin-antitoxin system antitoxin component (TIGR02293 family)|uniref:type II RES/Xre toxin-antitoxin system antitoxin n=1 Tax=unclassified Hydrogenophaga TaxID=2610897 RepID=UPI00132052D6|nr:MULTISPECIES: antitoxin Xre/MbcA/ParS toxin-binding domain-containing protein [unclassified Hydrogenophaga]MDP3351954.1 DUF2384 domain-containing protein [Hydrogenophaga sp.]QHE78656.1 DUF2384 domain-containing protein [Hydrogenophaga sp. PBL-H3]QHE83081.1 DUF2384 domain-containing protein [Hydrogenophaga sp. PBL-H3]